jgi:arginine transport system permease protein
MISSFFSHLGYFGAMLLALQVTLAITLSSLLLGLVLGLLFAILELNKHKFIRWPITLLITMIRSLPEILVVFIIALGMPYLWFLITGDFPDFSLFWLGVAALSLIFASYASQTIRGALLAVPKAQWESGYVLGLNKIQIFITLILPQTWRHALPGLGNQWLVLLKDSALISLIGLHDVMFAAESAFNATQKPFTWYSLAALIYLAISLFSQYAQKKLNSHITRYERP